MVNFVVNRSRFVPLDLPARCQSWRRRRLQLRSRLPLRSPAFTYLCPDSCNSLLHVLTVLATDSEFTCYWILLSHSIAWKIARDGMAVHLLSERDPSESFRGSSSNPTLRLPAGLLTRRSFSLLDSSWASRPVAVRRCPLADIAMIPLGLSHNPPAFQVPGFRCKDQSLRAISVAGAMQRKPAAAIPA